VCGLLGLLTAAADAADHVDAVEAAMHCQRHRGPDELGSWHDDDLALGFNRLSIIDIEHSHQPLRWGPTGQPNRYAITFNGEIYNYLELRAELGREHGVVFSTQGDTEVIIAAFHCWGAAAVRRLRGMFAFGIWDTQTKELFLARDPFGIKPLFLATSAVGTAFSTEKKSLLELAPSLHLGTELDARALQHYLVLQYVPEPETLHAAISRLESGCSAVVRPGEAPVISRYFHAQFTVQPFTEASAQGRYDEISDVVADSVAKHMRADVTVGAFLSGGIDSTAIAALAKRHNPDLITFTTGFEREGYSEVDVAAESAAAIGVRHVVRTVGPEEFAAALPEIVWYLDDPVADPALVPLWFVAKEARKHVKVVLSGEGADELFGGYTIYREPLSLKPFERIPLGMRRGLGQLSKRIPDGRRGKDLLRRGALTLEERYYGNARNFRDDELQTVLRDFHPEWGHTDVTAPIYARTAGWDPVSRMQYLDMFTWLRGDILVKADKVTMANSLELRVPFLDNEVFRVAAKLPYEQKVSASTTKYALRRALRDIVPAHVLERRKLGFPVPLKHWLRGIELNAWARDIITASQTDHLLDKVAALRMLDEHKAGVTDHSRRIWTILVFMLWHGIFVEQRINPKISEEHYPVLI